MPRVVQYLHECVYRACDNTNKVVVLDIWDDKEQSKIKDVTNAMRGSYFHVSTEYQYQEIDGGFVRIQRMISLTSE